jgi:hypothetical protein
MYAQGSLTWTPNGPKLSTWIKRNNQRCQSNPGRRGGKKILKKIDICQEILNFNWIVIDSLQTNNKLRTRQSIFCAYCRDLGVTIDGVWIGEWTCGLRHELSSSARTLQSCVRIPLEVWVSVSIYSVFVLFCVYVAALRRADLPSNESCCLCIGLWNWKSGHDPTRGCRAIDEWMNGGMQGIISLLVVLTVRYTSYGTK